MSVTALPPTEAEVPVASGDLGLSLIRSDRTEVIGPDPLVAELQKIQTTSAEVEVRQDEPVGVLRRVARRVARRVRTTLARVFSRVRFVASRSKLAAGVYVAELRRASTYRARHGVRRTWYGVQRSTARRNAARVVASRAAAKEGELPNMAYSDEFLSWLASFAETLREEDRALRHPTGRHFICS